MFKKFFNKSVKSRSAARHLKMAYGEIAKDFAPVIAKSKSKFKHVINKNPKRTFGWMMVILVANFGILYCCTNAFKSNGNEMRFSQIATQMYHSTVDGKALSKGQNPIQEIPLSFANYRVMMSLRDSLQYLMSKKSMDYSDTLLFVHLMDKFNELTQGKDTSIPHISLEDLRTATQTIRNKK
jgi:hypothetical protein